MEYLKVGQRVQLDNYGGGKTLTGEVRGMGSTVGESGTLYPHYIVQLDPEFQGYIAQRNGKNDNTYISHLVVAADSLSPLLVG